MRHCLVDASFIYLFLLINVQEKSKTNTRVWTISKHLIYVLLFQTMFSDNALKFIEIVLQVIKLSHPNLAFLVPFSCISISFFSTSQISTDLGRNPS